MTQENKLLIGLEPFFSLIYALANGEALAYAEVRAKVKESLVQFKQFATAKNIEGIVIEQAEYALIAFIDEWMIQQQNAASAQWMLHPMQMELLNENTAGENYFNHLNRLTLQAEKYCDLIEIYYILLQLGFEGKFRNGNKKALWQLKNELFSQIQQVRKSSACPLYHSNTNHEEFITGSQLNINKRAIGFVMLGLLCITCLSFRGMSYVQTQYYSKEINKVQLEN